MATNLERTDIVLGMDIEGGKPASLLKTDKKKRTGRGGHKPRVHVQWRRRGRSGW